MSEFGFRVRNAANLAVWFDSRVATAGVCLDFINEPANAAGYTRTYPTFVGRTVRMVSMDLNGAVGGAAVDYALGYPRLTVGTSAFPQSFMLVVS
ncbi:hypothetical protein SAMN05216359_105261 [Roseateles sp. YR242]|uniref:hypothetical protein n=1 Tax=Roseateles sp. YR242 TaxID=1855305 RepID=UPI0008B60D79|nr:hypothetical protein [Roseateles sp. YR242]SEL11825.1 hypothetical protein SAMN05216359_105261 [Roseateles sp. YR242]